MKRNCLLILIGLIDTLLTMHVSAQQSFVEDVLSPNAMDLGRYGDIPMNYFTGRANVSIPLFETKQRDVTLNINLSYDTGGLLMNSLPSWTGHGWTLNAGGCITRIKQGECDEYVFPEFYDNYNASPFSVDSTGRDLSHDNFRNYFQSCDEYDETISGTAGRPNSRHGQAPGGGSLAYKVFTYQMDSSPDIFYFNFLGKTGRFFLGPDKQWKVLCDENIDVVFDIDDDNNYIRPFIPRFANLSDEMMPKTIKGFMLIDENGTRYIFGGEQEGDTDAIEYSIPLFDMRMDNRIPFTANAWYLKRIEDRFGKTLYEFAYQRGKYITSINLEYDYTLWDKMYLIHGGILHYGEEYGGSRSFTSENSEFPFHVTVNSPVYLSEIDFADGNSVVFTRNTNISLTSSDLYPSLYDEINGKPLMNRLFAQYHFSSESLRNKTNLFPYFCPTQTYVYNANLVRTNYNFDNDDPFKAMEINPLQDIVVKDSKGRTHIGYHLLFSTISRLHLTGVDIYDSSNNEKGKYRFNYNDYSSVPADYLTTGTDHWGYCNGSPQYTLDYLPHLDHATFVNLKSPNNAAIKGSLREIVYPTGGRTEFDYELNSYSLCVSENRQDIESIESSSEPYKPPRGEASDSLYNSPDSTIIGTRYIANGVAGGLRIKSIKEYDGDKLLKSRTYSYVNPDGESSGVLFSKPRYYWPKWCVNPLGQEGQTNMEYDIYFNTTFRTISIVPLSNTFGTPIGYSYVKETLSDGTYTVYHFSNLSDPEMGDGAFSYSFQSTVPSPFDKYEEKDYLRGKLLSQKSYDSYGNAVSSMVLTYDYANDPTPDYVFASNMFFISHITGWFTEEVYLYLMTNCITYNAPFGVIYKMSYPKYTVTRKVETTSAGDESLTETTSYVNTLNEVKVNYRYPHLQRVLKVTSDTLTRGSDVLVNRYVYPIDSLNADTCFTKNYYLPLLSHSMDYNGNTISRNSSSFGWFQAGDNTVFAPRYELQAKRGSNGICTEQNDTLLTYVSYTPDGHLKQYTEHGKCTTNYFWDTVHDRLLAKVHTPGTSYDFGYNSHAADPLQRVMYRGHSLFSYPEFKAQVYSYDDFGNVTTISSDNGQTLYYEYDAMGRLNRIRDTNGNAVKEYEYHYSVNNN